MLNDIILEKRNRWLHNIDCPVNGLLKYIKNKGFLRDAQIEAIETYLFLKIAGNNKPLWQLFSEGFFADDIDLSTLNINQETKDFLQNNKSAFSLYSFAQKKEKKNSRLPNLEKLIIESPNSIDYISIIKKLFYNVNYSDYLMSLPMGAGKTYLMAAFIYLDLYFSQNEPESKNFAHNFLVLIPSGLKNSIGPSLRTIEKFDPSWVIPEPAATQLKEQLKFNILDEQKTNKKSNKARNPNAQKVNQCLPNPFGQVFIVNAEKVILDKVDLTEQPELIKKSEDEKDRHANELRNLISKIPHLSILIDEVHHATDSDIKLRKVVNGWNKKGSITTVLGFSGTPYLSTSEKIVLTDDEILKNQEISNTVYYYPLTTAIEKFLKKPDVKIADNMNHFQIIKNGIEDFNTIYDDMIYSDGTIPKLAIYCSNIEMLEEQIYPYLQSELNINPNEILKYHGGNKKYTLPKENGLEFKSLDTVISKKKYILLVAIGKEGWNCKSLTAVILPQKGASTSESKILQTACRCLREVIKGNNETALIWLNRENAEILNKRLKKEQHTSIEEINNLSKNKSVNYIERHSRLDFLKLPKIDFYQLQIKYQSIEEENSANTEVKLQKLYSKLNELKSTAMITTTGLDNFESGEIEFLERNGTSCTNYYSWLFTIEKESLNTINISELQKYNSILKNIFNNITIKEDGILYFNDQYDLDKINSEIRICYSIKKYLKTKKEIIPKEAGLLIIDKITEIEDNNNIFPDSVSVEKILSFDKNPMAIEEFNKTKEKRIIELTKQGKFDEISRVANEKMNPIIKHKDRTFHLLPYNFDSGFEREFLNDILQLKKIKKKNLEIYFNGERGLSEFVINCFAKKGKYWRNIGKYTTDFLLIKRNELNQIYKALIIETKGKAYANDKSFISKKNFVETDFLNQNEKKFGYKKFDFLYLEDSNSTLENMSKVNNKIDSFFKE